MGVHNFLYEMSEAFDTERITDPGDGGAIPVTQSGLCAMVTAGAETRTLAAPARAGLILMLIAQTLPTDTYIRVSCPTGVTQADLDRIWFMAEGHCVVLVAIAKGSNLRWRILETPE